MESSIEETSIMKNPFLTHSIQKKMKWRDGDIVVCVPFKSGTTWTMNICYQLREGGDSSFDDLYKKVPWIEFLETPQHTVEEIVKKLDEMTEKRRIFKTHSSPRFLPYVEPKNKDNIHVKYVVVFRNPEEALGSSYPFLAAHNEKFFEMWSLPKDLITQYKTFEEYYYKFFKPGDICEQFFENMNYWWPLRHKSNVLLIHYSDMKNDHEGSIRKISDFLGFQHSEEEWKNILEFTSFPWMKDNTRKFELFTFYDFPYLKKGGMVRRGSTDMQTLDGVTEEIADDLALCGKKLLKNKEAFKWLYDGGEIIS